MNPSSLANLRQGACVLIYNAQGQVLVVTRPDGQGIGLPGGKVEMAEDVRAAAHRELWEETGVRIDPEDLVSVHRSRCPAHDGYDGEYYDVTTFVCATPIDAPLVQQEPHVRPFWSTWEELLTNSPFASYNAQVQAALEHQDPSWPSRPNL